MTDEYRAFLESREPDRLNIPKWKPPERKESEKPVTQFKHSDIPHWRPSEEKEEEAKPTDFLAHHGIPGMKWGVRKDRKKTGSDSKGKKKEGESKKKTTSAKNMSDEELDAKIRRMQKEATYNQLNNQLHPKKPTKAERRRETMHAIFAASAVTAATAIMTAAYKKGANWMIKKASGGKVDLLAKSKAS